MSKEEKDRAGIYVHIPFCISKCIYCDFASVPGCTAEMMTDYFAALYAEIDAFNDMITDRAGIGGSSDECMDVIGDLRASFPAGSVFIGGGTPTSVPEDYIGGIMQRLIFMDDAEITIEANPGTVTSGSLKNYREYGINRISFGVQSFDDSELRFLGRAHNRAEAEEAFRLAREAGFDNINIDLMFGFPGQTLESWRSTLEKAVGLDPEHISFYSLQIEEGTPLYRMFRNDEAEQISDEMNREMYHIAVETLKEHGYEHYEISNAAKPGRRCAHNIRYWTMAPYIGFGAAAHSFAGGCRFFNASDIKEYIASVDGMTPAELLAVKAPVRNDEEDEISDLIFTGMRMNEGISLEDFSARFGKAALSSRRAAIDRYIEEGLLEEGGGRLRFTEKGRDLSNHVLVDLI